jgi:hypothetical protein
MRFRLRTLLLGLTGVCALLGAAVWFAPEVDGDYYVIDRFDFGENYELIIWKEWFWEVMPAYRYEITQNDRVIVPKRRFADGEDFKFEIVVSSDGTAVGVRDLEGPDRYDYLCMFDTLSGEGWPGGEMWWDLRPAEPETIALENRVCEKIEKKLRKTGAAESN